jgi:DNA-binding CsgD family transcriptional regulator/tetratricopeptide (TPR) repeat protein
MDAGQLGSAVVGSPRDLVGRLPELEAIGECVTGAEHGRARVVWLSGEAGSGKTGILRAVLDSLPDGFRVLRAEADELARDVALGVASQLGALTSTDAFGAGLELLEVIDRAQDDGPVAVAVEDLHWADVASRQALLTMARRLRDDRAVLLVTSRAYADPDGWARLVADPDRCLEVPVGPLSVEDVAELARRHSRPLDRAGALRLHDHTRGHALYVRTLLAELSTEQLTRSDGGLPAPRSLASTTVGRLAELSTDAQALASALAVINRRSPLDLVGDTAAVSDPRSALEPLLRAGLVTWWPSVVGTPIEFEHPLYRIAVYDDLSPIVRHDLHRAAAVRLDREEALAHRVAAAEPGDQELINDLSGAARDHEQRGELGLAARNWLWVTSLASQADQIDLGVLEATRLLLLDRQTARAQELSNRVQDCDPSASRSLLLGMLEWAAGAAPAAEIWLLDAASLAATDERADLEASALARLAWLLVIEGRGIESLETAKRALGLRPVDPEVENLAWSALVHAEGRLRGPAAALDVLDRRLRRDPSEPTVADADLLVTRGLVCFYAGLNQDGAADMRVAIRQVRQGASITQLPRAHLQLAQLLVILGDWDDAVLHARLGLSLVEDEGQVWVAAQAHAALASLLASRGDWRSAETHLSAAAESAAIAGTDEARFTARIAQSAMARARNEPSGVIEALAPLAGSGESDAIPMFTSLGWWAPLIHALIDHGDLSNAPRHIELLELAAADRQLDLRARILGLQAQLHAADGEPERAETLFASAASMVGPDDPMLDRAQLHHDYGRLLHARGKRAAAVDQLRAARDLLDRAGAEPFRSRVDVDLEACGLRAEPVTRSPLALTDREQDVAALVSKGLTNQQAADELYISKKAIEYHLRNIYGKLGITSRRELQVAP